MDNVNNLNGVPNFGHGWPKDEVEQSSIDEVETEPETEDKPKKKAKK